MAAIANTTAGAKICKKCGIKKELSEYNTHPKSRDGKEGSCRKCRNNRMIGYYIATHPNDPRRKDLKPEPLKQKEWKMGDPWFIFDN